MESALLRAGNPTVHSENWRIQETPVIEEKLDTRIPWQFAMLPRDGSTSPEGQVAEMTDRSVIQLKTCFDYSAIRELMRMGHKVEFANGVYGGYEAIRWDEKTKVYIGASEGRKDDQAAGH